MIGATELRRESSPVEMLQSENLLSITGLCGRDERSGDVDSSWNMCGVGGGEERTGTVETRRLWVN